MSVQNITEAQVVTGGSDGVDTPGRGEDANEGAKGIGVGAKCTGDGAEGTDGGAKGVRGAGSDGCEGSKDTYPDDLQLDVAMFEQPPPLKTFSAEDIITLNELPPALQRSPRVVNLSHLRSPRTSDGNMIFLTSSSKDAMKRVFHSLISIPTAASASDANSDGMLSPSDVMQTLSEDMAGVSAPMSIPVLVQNEVQMPCGMDDAHKTIEEQTKPPTVVIGPPTAVIEPPTAVIEPPTAVIEPPTAVIEPPTAVIEPPTAVSGPSTSVIGPPTAVIGPPTAVIGPPTAVIGPPTAVIGPPTAVIEPPTAVIGPPTTVIEPSTAVIGPPAINTVFSAKDHEASPREESLPSSPQITQYEQPQPKVSELRQKFLSGSGESPPYLTTVTSQRLQRSKLITQRARHVLGQEQASQEDSTPQVTASSPEVSSATPEKVPSEILSKGEQHSSEVKLVQHAGPPHMPGDDGSAGSDAKHAAGQQEADKARPPQLPIATGSPVGEASDHNEGRKEPPRGGHIIGDPRDLNVLPQRPHVTSLVFGTPGSRSPLQHHHRPASNLLVSMSAGSPGGRGSPGHTPPPSRRCEAVHTNMPQGSLSIGTAMSAGYLSNEASLDEAYDRTTPVISSPTPVISSPSPVISSPTPVISSPTPVTPFHARDVQSDIDGDDTSNRGDEEAWSSNSDDDLVSPLVVAPPPAKRVDTINSSRHHRHPQEAVLSASVKDCVAQMSKVVHTQPLFSEPRKIHLGRQGRKLSAIPEDSPTVSS